MICSIPDHRGTACMRPRAKGFGCDPDPAFVADDAVLEHRELRELAMHVHADIADQPGSLRRSTDGEPLGRNDTYGYALAAQPDKSQGRPTTNTGSQPTEQERPAHTCSPKTPVPDGRTVAQRLPPGKQNITRASASFHTGVPMRSSRSMPATAARSRPGATSRLSKPL